MKRTVAFLLALIAAVSLPLHAGAVEYFYQVNRDFYDISDPTVYDYIFEWIPDPEEITKRYDAGDTVKVSDWDDVAKMGDDYYEFAGFIDSNRIQQLEDDFYLRFPDADWTEYKSYFRKISMPKILEDIPVAEAPKTELEQEQWLWQYILAAYVPHSHWLGSWAKDPTNHWLYCVDCGAQFLAMNWHQDCDGDDICDVCGYEILYYSIASAASEGGTVAADLSQARYRDTVTVQVTCQEGYALDKLCFYKLRPDGSRGLLSAQEGTEEGSYLLRMPSFPVEINAEFVKIS